MEKFVISDEDFLEEVTVLVNKMWEKFSNLHRFMEKDDVISETMITYYGLDRQGRRRIDKYAEQGEKYFRNTLRYMVEKEFQGFYWRNENRKDEASLDFKVGDDEGMELGDLIATENDCFDDVYFDELLSIVPNTSSRNYYIIHNNVKKRLTDRDIIIYILKGFSISDLCDFVYSEYTGKLVQAQSLYTMYSDIKKNLKDLYKRKGIMGELCYESA